MEDRALEINLISAQGIKSTSGRHLHTYAVAWVDPNTKLRTRVDRIGGDNPTWNDKFIFKVSGEFFTSETAAVSVEIFAVGYIRDHLIGTVRFLVNNCLPSAGTGTPAFNAVQIRRPSGRFHGVLNIGVMVVKSDFAALSRASAIGYRDLMGENSRDLRRARRPSSGQLSGGESPDLSDGGESSTSSSSTASGTLKDWNGVRDGVKNLKLSGLGVFCGLGFQRKIRLSSSEPNFQSFDELENKIPVPLSCRKLEMNAKDRFKD